MHLLKLSNLERIFLSVVSTENFVNIQIYIMFFSRFICYIAVKKVHLNKSVLTNAFVFTVGIPGLN